MMSGRLLHLSLIGRPAEIQALKRLSTYIRSSRRSWTPRRYRISQTMAREPIRASRACVWDK